MPTYEFKCPNCASRREATVSIDDIEYFRAVCQICKTDTNATIMKRVFSPVGVVFKGAGFYSTDKKGSKSAKAAETKTERASTKVKSEGDKGTNGTTNTGLLCRIRLP